jgi:hypothetical protein
MPFVINLRYHLVEAIGTEPIFKRRWPPKWFWFIALAVVVLYVLRNEGLV